MRRAGWGPEPGLGWCSLVAGAAFVVQGAGEISQFWSPVRLTRASKWAGPQCPPLPPAPASETRGWPSLPASAELSCKEPHLTHILQRLPPPGPCTGSLRVVSSLPLTYFLPLNRSRLPSSHLPCSTPISLVKGSQDLIRHRWWGRHVPRFCVLEKGKPREGKAIPECLSRSVPGLVVRAQGEILGTLWSFLLTLGPKPPWPFVPASALVSHPPVSGS